MADTNKQEGFDEELFLKELQSVRDAVEKTDTPASHGALGEILYASRKDDLMKEAVPHLEIAANAGIAGAVAYLGDAYFNGRGVEKDIPKAMDFFYDAALDGDVDAMYSLGAAFFMGKDVPADYGKALDFLAQASAKGSSRAQNTLGLMYLGGFGTEQNIPKAKRLFNKAVSQGNVNAQKNLNMIREQGRRFNFRDFILFTFDQPEEEEKPGQD